jgi:hypothetical protein
MLLDPLRKLWVSEVAGTSIWQPIEQLLPNKGYWANYPIADDDSSTKQREGSAKDLSWPAKVVCQQ